jgi:hypothetical protein
VKKLSFEGEKKFQSAREIKYVYKPSKVKSDHLVVVFSGFNPKGTKPVYNYIRTLETFDVNKLFILDDYGERGCYYLGENRIFDIEASVVSLITWIANKNNILHSNIICCGSSKGGYASLYFGIKYGFGHVIVGAPQTKLGNYLYFAKEYPTLNYIAGDSSEGSIKFLDQLLYDIVSSAIKVPDITIHVGSGDHHYKGHVLPFRQHLRENNYDCNLDVKEYSDHGDVRHYQSLLFDKLIEKIPSLKMSFRISSVNVDRNKNTFRIYTKSNIQAQYAWYVFKDGERISTIWYTTENSCEFTAKEPGKYHFLAFAKDQHGNIISEKTNQFVLNEL